MPYILLSNRKLGKEEWVPLYDIIDDSHGSFIAFSVRMPEWSHHPGYHHVHLVHHHYPFSGIASPLWNASLRMNSARGLLEKLEQTARKEGWYDAERFPDVERHVGKVGMLIAGADLLQKFLETRPFDKPGYYDGRQTLILSGPPVNIDSEDYRD
jgi:hypothetical protein